MFHIGQNLRLDLVLLGNIREKLGQVILLV